MINTDEKEFNRIMLNMGVIFDKEVTETLLKLYFDALKYLTIKQIQKSADEIIKTSKFFPKPVDFRPHWTEL